MLFYRVGRPGERGEREGEKTRGNQDQLETKEPQPVESNSSLPVSIVKSKGGGMQDILEKRSLFLVPKKISRAIEHLSNE